jgi:hypothetical protein
LIQLKAISVQAPAAECVVFALYLIALEIERRHPSVGDGVLDLEELRGVSGVFADRIGEVAEEIDLRLALSVGVMIIEDEICLVSRSGLVDEHASTTTEASAKRCAFRRFL